MALTVVAGCSSSPTKQEPEPTPKGFDTPKGVTLTAGGSTLKQDKPATVVYDVGDAAASAITVTVTSIRKGDIKDFRFFSLDAESKASSPFYVRATIKNEGPAGLGGVSLPMFAHDSTGIIRPPNDLVGEFKPCPKPMLPKSFLPGSSAKLCLVYLVPKGKKLQSVDLQPGSSADAVSWKP